jgi:flagellar basal body-associated protein FliL
MRAIFVAVLSVVASLAAAEGQEGGVKYVTLQPAFVTNFGVTKAGRLTYLKADVTLKVANAEGEGALGAADLTLTAMRYNVPPALIRI